jgi:plasmid stability protein
MKALHIRDVDELVIHRLALLAKTHKRSMQAELRTILEEAANRAVSLEAVDDDALILTAVESRAGYGREEIYGDDAR